MSPLRPAPTRVDPRVLSSLADAAPRSFWLDDPTAPDPEPALVGETRCDLLVVGGGFTGLWTALQAKEEDPSLDVVLVDGRNVGWAASGRNGGFVAASLTHGVLNGVDRFPDEMPALTRMGEENLDGIEQTLRRHGIEADWWRNGELTVATEQWQLAHLDHLVEQENRFGGSAERWDADRTRAEVASPTYLGAVFDPTGGALVNPARLAWGLADACRALGVRMYENTQVTALSDAGGPVLATTGYGSVRAARVALATNVFPNLVRRARSYVIPVWDYVLTTEPLSDRQMAEIGWQQKMGIGDSSNQFHYYRLTADNRILWGGYDAIYYYGSGMESRHEQRPETFGKLAEHFFATFPQLEGVRFSHAWGGAIDTCSRFCAFWGSAYAGRVAYVMGYTGLGVAATRFGGRVMLDLLSGQPTERTGLDFVTSKPVPFPPEPFRFAGVQATRWSIDRADRHAGRRNLWLRSLDRLGLGFDS
ncbi:MAG: FAD-binding oxidoreductase [Actinomycetota bacterium]|nr:FAD-binding oxidoreductase [Actinomycetota bacterium]MDH4352609.1 FAD-binding oxidoreductase [Actinomycetota bacterium]MDH5277910.1 FAD-binding oxidoreductase [Actinomycetota bacterium]